VEVRLRIEKLMSVPHDRWITMVWLHLIQKIRWYIKAKHVDKDQLIGYGRIAIVMVAEPANGLSEYSNEASVTYRKDNEGRVVINLRWDH